MPNTPKIPTLDIIKTNLNKLEKAKEVFIQLRKYEKAENLDTKRELRTFLSKYGLEKYADFIDWIQIQESLDQEIIYYDRIPYNTFRDRVVQFCIDAEVKDSLKDKTKSEFRNFFRTNLWLKYSGQYVASRARSSSRRRSRHLPEKTYRTNFSDSQAIIANFIIQNNIDMSASAKFGENSLDRISKFYLKEIADVDSSLLSEIEITKDITNSMLRKIDSIRYDFKKINFNLLSETINKKIQEKVLSVDKNEKIKCLESGKGISQGNIYDVLSYSLEKGHLIVNIKNDIGMHTSYNYRMFDSISNVRNEILDELLN